MIVSFWPRKKLLRFALLSGLLPGVLIGTHSLPWNAQGSGAGGFGKTGASIPAHCLTRWDMVEDLALWGGW